MEVPDVGGVEVPVLVSVDVPEVVGDGVRVWSSSKSSACSRDREVLGDAEPDVLVFVFEVSECLASEVLVLVPDVLVFDDSEVLVFEASDVRDFPLTP